jgi:hypothetical protein
MHTFKLAPIQAYLENSDEDALVIFDVDDVLIQAKDQVLKDIHHNFVQKIDEKIELKYKE